MQLQTRFALNFEVSRTERMRDLFTLCGWHFLHAVYILSLIPRPISMREMRNVTQMRDKYNKFASYVHLQLLRRLGRVARNKLDKFLFDIKYLPRSLCLHNVITTDSRRSKGSSLNLVLMRLVICG